MTPAQVREALCEQPESVKAAVRDLASLAQEMWEMRLGASHDNALSGAHWVIRAALGVQTGHGEVKQLLALVRLHGLP